MAEEYDYIVVGSGAGGGPLAARLAAGGARVLLIEAGSDAESYKYLIPCLNAYASEERAMSWDYFVHHYASDEQRDWKYRADRGGVFYPRAGTLGGCTAHNAMITIVPHDSDWNGIAELTGDDSWRAERMRPYFDRVCEWLSVNTVDPRIGLGDPNLVDMIVKAATRDGLIPAMGGLAHGDFGFDPNQPDHIGEDGLTIHIPLAITPNGRRNGTREYIRRTLTAHPDTFTLRINTLVTRVLFDETNRAVGVECLEGPHLFAADPAAATAGPPVRREYRSRRDVILCGGAFNTPQLLMLSGIGPREHLASMNIPCRVDRPGVGANLQDRYEVTVVTRMKKDFSVLDGATFEAPADASAGDPVFQKWNLEGKGLYTSNGAVAAIIARSPVAETDPDLFIFGLPGNFRGYYPGYSKDTEKTHDLFTWAIIKAHTNNRRGTVRLRSNDPRQTADVNFHYFDENGDPTGADLKAVVAAVELVRKMNARNRAIAEEVAPGRSVTTQAQVADWVRNNAWGHHASCSCRIGRPDDPMAVVDSKFRVIGTTGLRVVDASVFPRIPGFFIVTPIYMVSEKAAEVIAA